MPSPQFKGRLCLALLLTSCIAGVTGFSPSPAAGRKQLRSTVVLYTKKPLPFRSTTSLSSPDSRPTRILYKPKPPQDDLDLAQIDNELLQLEKDIQESTKVQLDLRRLTEILEDDVSSYSNASVDGWQVSVAAGTVAGTVTLGVTDSWILAVLAFCATFVVANGDPLEERTPAGATARVVGRATLSTLEMLRPKFRAVARVALKGESEVSQLKRRLDDLELENANLLLWQQRRNAVDDSISKFTVPELKKKAREHKLPVGGTKAQLLMRLVEAEAIQLK